MKTKFPYINQWLTDVFPNDADRRYFLLFLQKLSTGQYVEPVIIRTNSAWDDAVMRFLLLAVYKTHAHKYGFSDHCIRGMLLISQVGTGKGSVVPKAHYLEMTKVQAHDVYAGAKEFQEFEQYLQLPDTLLS